MCCISLVPGKNFAAPKCNHMALFAPLPHTGENVAKITPRMRAFACVRTRAHKLADLLLFVCWDTTTNMTGKIHYGDTFFWGSAKSNMFIIQGNLHTAKLWQIDTSHFFWWGAAFFWNLELCTGGPPPLTTPNSQSQIDSRCYRWECYTSESSRLI